MQNCVKCNTIKPISEFYKHQKSECKECTKTRVRLNYRKNIDHYKEYERSRTHLPHRVKARKLASEPLLYCHTPKSHKAYPENTENIRALYTRRYNKKIKARDMLCNAVRDEKIARQPCVWCGSENNIHGHHERYSKPLDVIWLCAKHHSAVHHGKIKIF